MPPPPPPPPNWQNNQPRPPPPAPIKQASIRILDDNTPLTERAAREALTTYKEFTVRICEPSQTGEPRSWSRVAVTEESAEQLLVELRVEQFEERDGNVIEANLRMSEQQSGQVARIMDDIKFAERDYRFDWCWYVKISSINLPIEYLSSGFCSE